MTVRDGIYAVPAFIANTLIRRVVTGRAPAEGMETDYINTLCEHYKFILTVFRKRSIEPRANSSTSREQNPSNVEGRDERFSRARSEFPHEHGEFCVRAGME